MKNYSVLITAKCLVLVKGAKSEYEATKKARANVSMNNFEITETEAGEVPTRQLEQAERHADVISE